MEKYVGSHPSTLAFVQCPKPAPKSYGTQQYYSVTAFKLIDAAGKETFIRYHIVPDAGVETYDAETVKTKDADYLQTEIQERVKAAPISFKILAQVAEEGDVTDDATIHWPESRKVVELGSFKLDGVLADNAANAKYAIFDPIPRVEGCRSFRRSAVGDEGGVVSAQWKAAPCCMIGRGLAGIVLTQPIAQDH